MEEELLDLNDLLEEDFIVDEVENQGKQVKEKITPPIMSSFEMTQVISKRIKQLDKGYKSTIENTIKEENITKSYEIAIREFQLGKLPKYYIKRELPNKDYELWSHDDFLYFPI